MTVLPPGATVLASNDWSAVQALTVEHGPGRFWAVQYHPEYDLGEIAGLTTLRGPDLVTQGHFASAEDAEAWQRDARALHQAPGRGELAAALGASDHVMDEAERTGEVARWLASSVRRECPIRSVTMSSIIERTVS